MSRPERLNQRQYAFLRKVRNHPHGLPIQDWPRSADLRRWMKRPRFRAALTSLQATFHAESDLLLAGVSARAAMGLQDILSGDEGGGSTPAYLQAHSTTLVTLARLLRVDHLRQKEQSSRQLPAGKPEALSAREAEALTQARWEQANAAQEESAQAARAEWWKYASGAAELRVQRGFGPEPFGEKGQNEPKSALEISGNSPIMTDNSMEAGL
jgi:hypothetical protein